MVAPLRVLLVCGLVPLGACSLLFSESTDRAGGGDASEPVELVCGDIETTVGGTGNFINIEAWFNARAGDLTRRQQLAVNVKGDLSAGEVVQGGSGGCGGTVIGAASGSEVGVLTLDIDVDKEGCQIGDTLKGPSGTARVQDVCAMGTRETVIMGPDNGLIEAPLVIRDFIADADSYLTVEASIEQAGQPGMGIFVLSTDGIPSHGIDIRVPHTRVTGLEVTNWAESAGSNGSFEGVHVEVDGVVLDRLLVHDDNADDIDANSDGIYAQGDGLTLTVRNSILYNIGRAGIQMQGSSAPVLHVQNCTLANCMLVDAQHERYGCVSMQNVDGGTIHAVDTIALDSNISTRGFVIDTLNGSNGTFGESSHNASNDDSAPGPNSQVAGFDMFIDSGFRSENFHLSAAGKAALGSTGTALDTVYTHDIDGEGRAVGAWSIGADQPGPSSAR